MVELLEVCCDIGCDYHLIRIHESCATIVIDMRNCGDPNFSDVPDFMLGMNIEDAKKLRNSLTRHINKALRYRSETQEEEA